MKRKLDIIHLALKLLLVCLTRKGSGIWAGSPIQNLLQHVNFYSRSNSKARSIHFFTGMWLKYREFNNFDKSVMVKDVTGLETQSLRGELSHSDLFFRSHNPNIGPTHPMQLVIKLDKKNHEPLDCLPTLFSSSGIKNISLVWENNGENFDAKTLVPYFDRNPEEFEKIHFNEPQQYMDPRYRGIIYKGDNRSLPSICMAQANQFLKTSLGPNVTVCIYVPEDETGFADGNIKKLVASFKSTFQTVKDAKFLLLSKTSPSNKISALLDKTQILAVRPLGVDDFGALGLAAACDVYFGTISEFSLVAAGHNKQGVYLLEGKGQCHHDEMKQQWFLNEASYSEALKILKTILVQIQTKNNRVYKGYTTKNLSNVKDKALKPITRNGKLDAEILSRTNGWERRVSSSKYAKKPEFREVVTLYIDIFGHCNLRCPSCPVGNWSKDDSKTFSSGLIKEETFRLIIEKSLAETSVSSVGLFNWTEPLLNPDASKFVRIVKSYGLNCSISSNLNVLRDPIDLMESGLDWMRVSVSGFYQDTYVKNHVGGDIEVVKQNMKLISEAKEKTGAKTDLELFFHKYKDNEHEEEPMRAYATSLGFRFSAAWAYLMPVEKMLSIDEPQKPMATLTEDDFKLVDRLALEPRSSLKITKKHKVKDCNLFDFLTIDINANLFICCASSGSPTNIIGNYLELSIEQIREHQAKHSLCGPCMKAGLPILYGHADKEFDTLGELQRELYREKNLG